MSWLQLNWETSESTTGRDRLLFGPDGYIKKACHWFVCKWWFCVCMEGFQELSHWFCVCMEGFQELSHWSIASASVMGNTVSWCGRSQTAARLHRRRGHRHVVSGWLWSSLQWPSGKFKFCTSSGETQCPRLPPLPPALVIAGADDPVVDIIVDIAPIGNCTCCKSIAMVCQILSPTWVALCEGVAKRPLMVEVLGCWGGVFRLARQGPSANLCTVLYSLLIPVVQYVTVRWWTV